MIDWDKVVLGETVLVDGNGTQKTVLARVGDKLWMKWGIAYFTTDLDSVKNWSIDDPWLDVTEECTVDEYFNIHHKGKLLDRYRYKAEGMRIFKWRNSSVFIKKGGHDE